MTTEQKIIRRRKRQSVQRSMAAVQQQAGRAAQAQKERDRRETKKTAFDATYQDVSQASPSKRMGLIFLGVAAPLSALLVDYLLLSGPAEYLIDVTGRIKGIWADVALVLIPTAIVIIEMGISGWSALKRETLHALEEEVRPKDRLAYIGTKVLGLLTVLAVTAAVVATQMAGGATEAGYFGSLLTFQVALTLVLHAMVGLSEPGHTGRVYALYAWRKGRHERALIRLDRREQAATQAAGQAYADYEERLRAFNTRYPEGPISVGPFSRSTREVLNAYFGFTAIALDAEQPMPEGIGTEPGPAGATPPEQPVPSDPAQSGPAAEANFAPSGDGAPLFDAPDEEGADYLRTILEQRRRDNDSML